jgi:hypothetical protein
VQGEITAASMSAKMAVVTKGDILGNGGSNGNDDIYGIGGRNRCLEC